MPVRDDKIYIDSSVTPPIGVSVADVQEVLGTSKYFVNELCTHEGINIWSKYKPVRYGYMDTRKDPSTGASWLNSDYTWKTESGSADKWWRNYRNPNTDLRSCGFHIPMAQIDSLPSSGLGQWTYERPQGGQYDPYRMLDFNMYYKKATCPYTITLPEEATQPLFLDGKISCFTPSTDPQNLSFNDIFGTTGGQAYIGIAAFLGNQMYWRTQESGSPTITFQGCPLAENNANSTLRLVAFATRRLQTSWTNSVDTAMVYSLNAPNITFSVIGDCLIKPKPTISYDIDVWMDNLSDRNFMRILKTALVGEFVRGSTRYGQTSQDRLSKEYTLQSLTLKIYEVDSAGGLTLVGATGNYDPAKRYSPATLEAGESYLPRESFVKYDLKTKEPLNDIPDLDASKSYLRQYTFYYE